VGHFIMKKLFKIIGFKRILKKLEVQIFRVRLKNLRKGRYRIGILNPDISIVSVLDRPSAARES